MKITLASATLDLTPKGKSYTVSFEDRTVSVEVLSSTGGELRLLLDGKPISAYVSADGAKRWVTVNGQTCVLTKSAGEVQRSGHGHHHTAGELVAPMPGQVRAVQVAEGDLVTKGQTLVVVEAMKMEIKVAAPRDGKVKSLKVKQGQTVERDQMLVEIE
jgi:biotin carboxyl carrier protein